MRRSLLFIPGNNPAMLQNSDIFGSDTVIFDLEDAVDISEKDAARTLVSEYSKTLQGGRTLEIAVRVNGFDTGLLAADLKEIVSDSIDTVVLVCGLYDAPIGSFVLGPVRIGTLVSAKEDDDSVQLIQGESFAVHQRRVIQNPHSKIEVFLIPHGVCLHGTVLYAIPVLDLIDDLAWVINR